MDSSVVHYRTREMSVCWTWNGFFCRTLPTRERCLSAEHEMDSSVVHYRQERCLSAEREMDSSVVHHRTRERCLSAERKMDSSVVHYRQARCLSAEHKMDSSVVHFRTRERCLSAERGMDSTAIQCRTRIMSSRLNMKCILLTIILCRTSRTMSFCRTWSGFFCLTQDQNKVYLLNLKYFLLSCKTGQDAENEQDSSDCFTLLDKLN